MSKYEPPIKVKPVWEQEKEYVNRVWQEHENKRKEDVINHPSHYTSYPGIEVIELTEHLNFCRGNAVKYIARAGLKSNQTEVEDLKKAVWYINREIERLERE